LKFFTKFEKSEHNHESKEIEIEIPKKKFVSKVKSFQKSDSKNNSKTIF